MAILKIINGNYIYNNCYINLVNYIFKEDNIYKNYYGCQYLYNNGNEGIAQQFQAIANNYHQNTGVLLYHYVVSFSHTSEGWVSSEIALRIVEQAISVLPYASIWCVHGDTDDIHVHIVMSPVNIKNGLKYTNKKDDHENLAEKILVSELVERKNIGTIHKKTYGISDEEKEKAYTFVPECLVVYE